MLPIPSATHVEYDILDLLSWELAIQYVQTNNIPKIAIQYVQTNNIPKPPETREKRKELETDRALGDTRTKVEVKPTYASTKSGS